MTDSNINVGQWDTILPERAKEIFEHILNKWTTHRNINYQKVRILTRPLRIIAQHYRWQPLQCSATFLITYPLLVPFEIEEENVVIVCENLQQAAFWKTNKEMKEKKKIRLPMPVAKKEKKHLSQEPKGVPLTKLPETQYLFDKDREQVGGPRDQRLAFPDIIGGSDSMQEVENEVSKYAPSDATVIVLGESGVGKEMFAKVLHILSPRRRQPFVAINAGSIT